MHEFIYSWVASTFGLFGQTVLVATVSILIVSTALPSVIYLMNWISPRSRRRRKRIEDIDIALKLKQLEQLQVESGSTLIDVREEWQNLTNFQDRLMPLPGQENNLQKAVSIVSTRNRKNNTQHQLLSTDENEKKGLFYFDPTDLTLTQKVILSVPVYLISLLIGAFAVTIVIGVSLESNSGTVPGYGWVFAACTALVALIAPINSLEEMEKSDLVSGYNPLKYFVFLIGNVISLYFGMMMLFMLIGLFFVQ